MEQERPCKASSSLLGLLNLRTTPIRRDLRTTAAPVLVLAGAPGRNLCSCAEKVRTRDGAGLAGLDAAIAAVVAARLVVEVLVTEAIAGPRLPVDQRLVAGPAYR